MVVQGLDYPLLGCEVLQNLMRTGRLRDPTSGLPSLPRQVDRPPPVSPQGGLIGDCQIMTSAYVILRDNLTDSDSQINKGYSFEAGTSCGGSQ